MSSNWHCIQEPWRKGQIPATRNVCDNHPLSVQGNVTTAQDRVSVGRGVGSSNTSSRSSSIIGLDPLSIAFDGIDPLSQFAIESERQGGDALGGTGVNGGPTGRPEMDSSGAQRRSLKRGETESSLSAALSQMESWTSRRAAILNKYTTTERLSIVTSFLTGGETIKSQVTIAEKVRHRLEQLDVFEDGTVKQMDVTQQEYVQKIELLNSELVNAWNTDQRVNSLKIAIQCSKLLGDTSVLRFYPSQFVLITDVLDMFGRLVYDRLKQKSGYVTPGTMIEAALPDNFTADMVPEQAKETCQNWFYKISSIRELLPRFYVEVAILKCNNFLDSAEIERSLLRLTGICRGIGDPLVAIYARCYLCRVGLSLSNNYRYLLENANDILLIYHTAFNNGLKAELTRQRIDLHLYLSLYIPALNWIIEGLAVSAPHTVLEDFFRRCCEKKNCSLLLHSIMSSYKPEFIAKYSVDLLNTILLNSSVEDITKFQLMRMLGSIVAEKPISAESRYLIMDAALKFVTSLRDPKDFMGSLESWAEFTAKYFPLKQINFIMNDILSHLTPDREFEKHYPELQNVIERIVANVDDFEGLMTMDNFLPVIDLFQKESVKLDVCKSIMSAYRRRTKGQEQSSGTSDPVFINNLMFFCRILNDSTNSLTVDDERRQICALVSHFIQQVNFGKDFEAQLAFYAEARAALLNLDAVYSTLVTCVVRLMCRMRGFLLGRRSGGHTKKTLAFARACAAFCFITIPSIQSVPVQMDLYYLAGGAALTNNCLAQADACFKAAIALISQLTTTTTGGVVDSMDVIGDNRSIDAYLLAYVPRLLTLLVVTPDSPDMGMLHLPNSLMEEVLQLSPSFENKSTMAGLYLMLLDFYTTIAEEVYPHRLPEVISNDRLYGGDRKFISEVEATCNQIVDAILEQLQMFGEMGQMKWQAGFALELFQKIVFKSDLSEERQFSLAVNLWSLAMKNRQSLMDPQLPARTVADIEARVRLYEASVGECGQVPVFVEGLRRILPRILRKL